MLFEQSRKPRAHARGPPIEAGRDSPPPIAPRVLSANYTSSDEKSSLGIAGPRQKYEQLLARGPLARGEDTAAVSGEVEEHALAPPEPGPKPDRRTHGDPQPTPLGAPVQTVREEKSQGVGVDGTAHDPVRLGAPDPGAQRSRVLVHDDDTAL